MVEGTWLDATLDIDRASEFTGDDVDCFSSLVDLGRSFKELLISLPAIDAATVVIYGQEQGDAALVPKVIHYFKPEAAANVAWATTSGTGALTVTCNFLGGIRYIRLFTSANQTADRTIRVRGINP